MFKIPEQLSFVKLVELRGKWKLNRTIWVTFCIITIRLWEKPDLPSLRVGRIFKCPLKRCDHCQSEALVSNLELRCEQLFFPVV